MIFGLVSGVAEKVATSALNVAWKGTRGFYDGISGNTSMNGFGKGWRDSSGNAVKMNPAQKLARRLRADAQQIVTGKKYNHATMEAVDTDQGFLGRHIGNRIGGALHLAGDITLGTMGVGLGWGLRGAGLAGLAVTKPIARATGHLALQGTGMAVGTASDMARTIFAMNKSGMGREALFLGGATGALAIGGSEAFAHNMVSDFAQKPKDGGLGFYYGGSIDSAPGTLASQGAGQESNMMVDTGANGDLVLALHQLR